MRVSKKNFFGIYFVKKKVAKVGTFRPKPWVNPVGKISIFRGYELLVFIA